VAPTEETYEPTVETEEPTFKPTRRPSTKPIRPTGTPSTRPVSVAPSSPPQTVSCSNPTLSAPPTYVSAQFFVVQMFGNYSATGAISNSSLTVLGKTMQCVLWGSKYSVFTPLVTASSRSNPASTFAVAAIQPTTINVAFLIQFFFPPSSSPAQTSNMMAAYYGNLTATISASFISGQFTTVLRQLAQQQQVSIVLGSIVAQQKAPTYTKAEPVLASLPPAKNGKSSAAPVSSSSASTNNGASDFFSAGNMPVYILVIVIAVLLPVLIWLWCTSTGRRPDRIDLADKQLQNWTIAPVKDVPIVAKHVVATKSHKSNSIEDFYYEVSRKQAVPRNAGPLSGAHSAVVAPTDSRYNKHNQKALMNEYLQSQRDNQQYGQSQSQSQRQPSREHPSRHAHFASSSSSSINGLYDPGAATTGPRMLNAADADVTDPWEEEYRYKEYQQFQTWMEDNPAARENAAVDPEPWQRDEQYRKYREFQGQKEAVINTQKILEQQLLERELQKELMKNRPPPPPQSAYSNRDYGYNQSRSNRDVYPQDRDRDRGRGGGERRDNYDSDAGSSASSRGRPYAQRGGDDRERSDRAPYPRDPRDPRDYSRERERERDRSQRR